MMWLYLLNELVDIHKRRIKFNLAVKQLQPSWTNVLSGTCVMCMY